MLGELSGERAMDYIHKISRFHRIRGGGEGSGYNRAVDFVVNRLKEIGLENIKVERFRSDGFVKYLGWRSPVGWRVRSAKLWMVKPAWELVADFSRIAVSLMPYSNGGSVQAEVVYAGEGKSDEDYKGIDVQGKIVFATGGNGSLVHKKAVLERKALGIVVGPSNRKDRLEYADLVEMYRLMPTGDERARTKWGFSISRRRANHLLEIFKKGKKIVMKAEVDADLFDGEMPVVSAIIKGTRFPEQEVIIMGHLDHYKPGANDNASGSAGMIEIARTFITLIKEAKINPPLRTIRFLWLPELHGAMAYASKFTDIGKRGLAGINLDMIAENYEKCRGFLLMTEPPFSAPGFTAVVIEDMLNWVDGLGIHSPRGSFNRLNFRNFGYIGGSDHTVFCDPSVGVPSVMLVHYDVFHHTSMDTPDKCDPTELKRVMTAAAMATYVICYADDEMALKIARVVHKKWLGMLNQQTVKSMNWLNSVSSDPDFSKKAGYVFSKVIRYSKVFPAIEKKALEHVKSLCRNKESFELINNLYRLTEKHSKLDSSFLNDFYRSLCKKKNIKYIKPGLSALEKKARLIFPRRLVRGPLPYRALQHQLGENYLWYLKNRDKIGGSLGSKVYELMNLSDGSYDLLFIRDLLSVEFSETDAEFLIHVVEDLQKLKQIEITRK